MLDHNDQRQKPYRPYQAYLVRLWSEGAGTVWRASAQSVQSGETIRFASLDALFTFLYDQTCDPSDQLPDDKPSTNRLM